MITGSLDHTIKLWDVGTGKCIHIERAPWRDFGTQFNFSSSLHQRINRQDVQDMECEDGAVSANVEAITMRFDVGSMQRGAK